MWLIKKLKMNNKIKQYTLEEDLEYFGIEVPTLDELFLNGEIDGPTYDAQIIAEQLGV
jgi:hypothetical protein